MKENIIKIIFNSINEINTLYDYDIEKTLTTPLFGPASALDSLGLVNLIVSVEDAINTEFNTQISIADEKAMSQTRSPFRNVESLTDYILFLLEEDK